MTLEFPDTSFYILVAIFVAVTAIFSANVSSNNLGRIANSSFIFIVTFFLLLGLFLLIGEIITSTFKSFKIETLGYAWESGVLSQFLALIILAIIMLSLCYNLFMYKRVEDTGDLPQSPKEHEP